jgi:hypothetical protein
VAGVALDKVLAVVRVDTVQVLAHLVATHRLSPN